MCQRGDGCAIAGSSLAARQGESRNVQPRGCEGVAGPDAELDLGTSGWNGGTAPPLLHRPANKHCWNILFYFFLIKERPSSSALPRLWFRVGAVLMLNRWLGFGSSPGDVGGTGQRLSPPEQREPQQR